MPSVRALTDLNIKGIYVPLNRVAVVDDDTATALIDSGQATDEEGHVEQALHMNPEIIEISGKPGTRPKPKPADESLNLGENDPADPAETGGGDLFSQDKPAPGKKAKAAPEEQANGGGAG